MFFLSIDMHGKRLGASTRTSSLSQTKGVIERANVLFQHRLVQKLRSNKIATSDKANKYIAYTFVTDFNKNFSLVYNKRL